MFKEVELANEGLCLVIQKCVLLWRPSKNAMYSKLLETHVSNFWKTTLGEKLYGIWKLGRRNSNYTENDDCQSRRSSLLSRVRGSVVRTNDRFDLYALFCAFRKEGGLENGVIDICCPRYTKYWGSLGDKETCAALVLGQPS